MTAFPLNHPADLDDPAVIAAHDWDAFRGLDAMHDHWRRPGWTPGRRSYHWMITIPGTAVDVRALAADCQTVIAQPGLDPVPLDSLHITLGRIGFTDEVTHQTAALVAEAGRAGCADVAPIELAIGPLAGSRGAIRFSVSPWQPLIELHLRLSRATSNVLGVTTAMDTRRFRPHLSIAYANTTIPVAPLAARVERLREQPRVIVAVAAAVVVEMWRDGHSYRYRTRYVAGFPSAS